MSNRESPSALESPPALFGQDTDRFARVVRVIEGEIVPRFLMSSTTFTHVAGGPENARSPRDGRAGELARLLVSDNPWLAGAFIQAVYDKRVPVDRICLEILAPSAREMRVLWEHKECDLARFLNGLKQLLFLLQFMTESKAAPYLPLED